MGRSDERPYVSFAEAKMKISLPDVLEKFAIADQFVRRGDCWTGPCPLPSHPINKVGGERNRDQFKINQRDGTWLFHCFAGDHQIGGDVIRFVQEMLQCDIAHVRIWLAREFGQVLHTRKPTQNEAMRPDAEANKKAGVADELDPQSPAQIQTKEMVHKQASVGNAEKSLKPLRFSLRLDKDGAHGYLRSRGLTDQTIERVGAGLCTKGFFSGYICFPLHRYPRESADERPCGYYGRLPREEDFSDDQPKHRLPADFPKSLLLYGLEAVNDEGNNSPWLVVIEGVIPSVYLRQCGYPCVSSFGSSLSDSQIDLLVQTKRNIALMFDGDQAGISGMRTGAGKLITRVATRVVKLADGQQPDHLSLAELGKLLGFVSSR